VNPNSRKLFIDRITGLTKGFPINYQVHPVILSKISCFSPFLKIFILCALCASVADRKAASIGEFLGFFWTFCVNIRIIPN
jgi:hypothetical protein